MLICVTNRKLCHEDFFYRISQIASGNPYAIMLREKDLSILEYEYYALRVKEICKENQVKLIINQNIQVARRLKVPNIHFSISDLKKYSNEIDQSMNIGASVHSVEEAKEAHSLGASYLIAGHIFSTDCKKGVPPRGLPFLKEVCYSVNIPVFAIGGITLGKVKDVMEQGAQGICIMSEAMTCENPHYLSKKYTIV